METNNQKNDQNIIPNDADKQQKGVNVPNLRFKEFIRKQQYFADALPCDLSKTLGGKTKSLVRILQFFNKFGITMFGVVS